MLSSFMDLYMTFYDSSHWWTVLNIIASVIINNVALQRSDTCLHCNGDQSVFS